MTEQNKHYTECTKEELINIVNNYKSAALDLAQHLFFTNSALKLQYKPTAYKRAEEMA